LPGKSDANGPPAAVLGIIIRTLTSDDIDAIAQIPGVTAATGYVTARAQMSSVLASEDTDLVGVSAAYTNVEDQKLSAGRFFSEDEEHRQARVIVLGPDVKEKLFGESDPVGQTVRFKGMQLMVIGVAEKRGSSLFGNFDTRSYAPIGVVQKEILGINYVNFARAKYAETDRGPETVALIEQILRRRHRITSPDKDDFSVRSTDQAAAILSGITGAIAAFLLAITSISLLVGGIGIMNIMLVAISERYREIGLRKALGASNKDVLKQFLIESALISIIAGIIGITIGAFFAWLMALGVRAAGYDWQLIIQPGDIAIAVGVSGMVGVLAGLYPAIAAARFAPTEALKSQ
jgi:putative ABC transport system permease protein